MAGNHSNWHLRTKSIRVRVFGCHGWCVSLFLLAGGQPEREDKVSLELAEEIIQSMEVGMAFRDYVRPFTLFWSFVSLLVLLIHVHGKLKFFTDGKLCWVFFFFFCEFCWLFCWILANEAIHRRYRLVLARCRRWSGICSLSFIANPCSRAALDLRSVTKYTPKSNLCEKLNFYAYNPLFQGNNNYKHIRIFKLPALFYFVLLCHIIIIYLCSQIKLNWSIF